MSNLTDYTGGTWATLLDKPAVIAAGVDAAAARTSIGAGTSSFSGDYNDLANKPTLGTAAATAATAYATAAQGTKADSALQPAALTNTALAGVPTAPNAATGTNTTQLATTAFVNAEIAADAAPIAHVGSGGTAHAEVTTSVSGFMSAADKTKLNGIAVAATANATDASLRDRTTHTGTQAISTVTGLQNALDGKAPLNGTGTSGTWPISVTGSSASLLATDNRSVKPNEIGGRLARTFFASKTGMEGGAVTTDWVDLFVINSYSDATGGRTNALAFSKIGEGLWHYQGAFNSTGWNAPKQIAYTDSSITGNAATATKLATARTINGVSFDGTANIVVEDTTKAPIAHVGASGAAHAEASTSVSGFMSAADKTKLDSIATAATANATDAALRDRATHTGTQAISTVTGLDTALAGKAPLDGTGTSGSWPISVTGNAATATKLTTARTINGVSFDGTANITVADSTKLPTAGGTMTGAITFAAGQTWPTFNQSTTGNAATATKLATARTIGGVSFDGSANIDLPGVNTTGNQNTTGNAATATKLATARTINGVAFDGTANVTITAQPVFAQQHSDNTSNGIPFAAGVEYSLRVNGTYSRSTPASPAIGDKFILNNLYDTWGSGLFTLTRGSPNHKINNIQEDVIFDVNVRRVELTYIYANEWIMAIS